MDVRRVLEQRLATQHLTGAASTVAGYVSEALAVQSQDPGTARWSIGMRTGLDDAGVRASIDAGVIVRAHVLRPTWHYVHRDDLRWLQRLTGEKVASSMPARHRQLGVDHDLVDRGFEVLQRELAGRNHLTRKQLAPLLPATGAPHGQVVGHLLMLAELRGLICSGPLVGTEHSYALVDEVLEPDRAQFDAQDATRELVRRFFTWHGPASVRDLARWCTLTLGQIRAVIGHLGLTSISVDETELWYAPERAADGVGWDDGSGRAFLLPTFDEVFLSYLKPNFPRSPGHPAGDARVQFSEAGGGLVVIDATDAGTWKRSLTKGRASVRLNIDGDLDPEAYRLVADETDRLTAFTGS